MVEGSNKNSVKSKEISYREMLAIMDLPTLEQKLTREDIVITSAFPTGLYGVVTEQFLRGRHGIVL